MNKGYLVLGFVPDAPAEAWGVHTPLRSDGYYRGRGMATGVANLWRENRLHSEERIVVVQIVNDDDDLVEGGSDGL